ncbi:GntR family transcriptional regulator [Romboutsia weinsteinii]|uniref:GntR family transcriptional regulator n=1 Tax=Romboutsia weinsteinii TaxID=2020949 RepID=A0A371JAL5_9FIRM|nr:GntR family transcriptional regulator [Romboutsia weinsteinii]RDY29697.1 GntR family transcriptional regulator [Romboutsia weinsteinii]
MSDKNTPLYKQIKDYLLNLIDENKHIPNYKLPSENQLALKFNASRISAKSALNSLQDEDLIYRLQGKGTFINSNINSHKQFTKHKIDKESTSLNKDIICMLVPGIDSRFAINIINGAKAYLESTNFKLVLMITDANQNKEKDFIRTSLDLGCKGLIIFPSDNQLYNPEILKLSLNKFPTVLVDRKLEGLDISYVASDHFNSAYQATNYLIDKGHTNIGFISPPPKVASSISERILGYEKALSSSVGLRDQHKLMLPHTLEDRISSIKNYLSKNKDISAIICEGGITGLNLIKIIYSMNLTCPNNIELILYDNEFEQYMDFLPCKPIVIEQNPYDIGYQSAKMVFNLINDNSSSENIIVKENIIFDH